MNRPTPGTLRGRTWRRLICRELTWGLTSAWRLFARRRMGKSEFLEHDLLPAALRAGYLAAYTNLWDDTEHPGQALATAIVLAVQPRGLGQNDAAGSIIWQ